jgi:hypothetical protein
VGRKKYLRQLKDLTPNQFFDCICQVRATSPAGTALLLDEDMRILHC